MKVFLQDLHLLPVGNIGKGVEFLFRLCPQYPICGVI